MADRVTQQVLQVGFQADATARVTSLAVEVLQVDALPDARVTSLAVEVLQSIDGGGGGGGGGSSTSIMYVIAS